MALEFEDMTGKPVSDKDLEDALAATLSAMNPNVLMKLPPELAVNIPNVRRCLTELRRLRTVLRKLT